MLGILKFVLNGPHLHFIFIRNKNKDASDGEVDSYASMQPHKVKGML